MTTIGSLIADLTLESAKFRRDLGRARRDLKSFESKTNRTMAAIDRGFVRATRGAKAFIAAFAAQAGIRGIDQTLDSVARLADTADKLGLATDRLQELRFAAEQNSIAQNTLDLAIQRFTRRVGEAAQGSGELKGTLDQYGISVRNADGTTRSIAEVLGDLADRIQAAESDSERLRIAFKAFDSEGAAVVNILRDGRAGLEQWTRRAQDAGAVMDAELIQKAREANREWREFVTVVGVQAKSALIGIIDVLRETGENLKAFAEAGELRVFARESVPALQALQGQLSEFRAEVDSNTAALERLAQAPVGPRSATLPAELGRELEAATVRARALQTALDSLGASQAGDLGLPIPGAPPPAPPPPSAEELAAQDRIRQVTDDLRFQSEQLERAAEVQRVYNEARRAGVEVDSAAGREIRDLVERIQEAERAQEAATERARAAQQVVDATRTPLERYRAEIARLNDLLSSGAINQDTYSRAVEQAQDRLEDATRETDLLGRAIDGGLNAALNGNIRSWEDLGRVALGVLADIARDMLRVQDISAGGIGSSVLGGIGNVLFPGGGIGGGLKKAQFGMNATVGGSGGTDSQLVQFMATPGEDVLVRTPAQQMQGGGGGRVEINQVFQVPQDRLRDTKFLVQYGAQIKEATVAEVATLIRDGRL